MRRKSSQILLKKERKPEDKSEVKSLMLNDRGYQSWSLLQRLSQQMMFTSVIDTVERNLDTMIDDLENINRLEA
ncbi:MAG: hypothetical protein Ct9H90mP13_12930 [Pseudomonadota bacterium]|nr:MAG: hypothetical protein Ct9H90mP13_12930 [Pseudomonadota bacterium]